jgi:hypothetical protein
MNSIIKATSYIMVHTPDMVLHNGSTQTTERIVNPESEYLKKLPGHIRSYEDAVAYAPNQTYIGNMTPEELRAIPQPWYDKKVGGGRYGKFGEIMPQDEFYLLMQICDVFDLIKLERSFAAAAKVNLANNPFVNSAMLDKVKEGIEAEEINRLINDDHAEGLYHNGALVGCVKRAHDVDINLSAHIILENLVSKASSVLALLHIVKNSGINPGEIEYVIDCSEEACGDANQRGGGNFAKAAAEIAGLNGATGSDVRGFCAAPAHALIMAASLVKAGVYKNVIVVAGGCTAKLGMNGKDHVKKEMPVLEDVLGGFAVLISINDGVNPEINLDIVGRHTVGAGSSPQAVITALVAAPLDSAGVKITNIDKYSVEMQNPEVTKPAGAGDVPLSNYKMIAALAVKRGELEKAQLTAFPLEYGLIGWAPTQGHIPSGVPYVGFACQDILDGKIKNAMIIGKGSLFLGRMTNLFDGVSFVIQANSGVKQAEAGVTEMEVKKIIAKSMREFAQALMGEQEGK